MASAEIIVRGATLVFTVTFTDINGDITMPDSANLYLAYKRERQAQLVTIAMTPGATTWVAEWESSVADAGQLDWHVRSANTPIAALQGSLHITINRANPAA